MSEPAWLKLTVSKATILANAATLRSALDARYQRFAECSNPEIVTRVRASGASDCVFVVNDHREFGTYVGQHGLVMENGLPSDGQLTIRRNAGHVYDLLTSRGVGSTVRGDTLSWPVQLGPCEGGVFLVTPRPIEQLNIAAPESTQRGDTIDVDIMIGDSSGTPIPAVIPLRVDITDPAGRPAEWSGYYGAANGTLKMKLDFAGNDALGVWQIRIRDLASGLIASRYVRVRNAGK